MKYYFDFHKHGEPKTYYSKKLKKHVTTKGGSLCSQCGATKHQKPFYRLWFKGGWSRSDDVDGGIYCTPCMVAYEKQHFMES